MEQKNYAEVAVEWVSLAGKRTEELEDGSVRPLNREEANSYLGSGDQL
ncbi:hypothetical protein [Propionimicrobium sp. PCR01-08-3]|nr:hypothetical protein [Propionimicrobium sp. PCR01-08-3]WIY81473.1 hypothetical protein QQ658_07925 [Propionimicrobium sp. PCR01-08-3]